jgi:O-antigen ligase
MWLICTIDVVAVVTLLVITLRSGLEEALPFAAFIFILVSRDAAVPLPGLFDLSVQRVILAVLTVLYFAIPPRKGKRGSLKTPLKWLLIAHIAWCFLSTANSIVPMMSFKKMISEIFEYYLLYYIFYQTIRDPRTINRVLFGIVAAFIGCSILGIFEIYTNWSVMDWFPYAAHRFDGWSTSGPESGRDVRVVTTFAHPILYGAGLTMGIVLTLYLIKSSKTSGRRLLLWIGLLIMFLNIYKTSSRGPWLGVALAMAVLLLWDRGRVRKYLMVIGVLVAAVLVIRPGVWETIANMYIATFDPNSPLGSSYEYRFRLKQLSMQALAKDMGRSVWGYGMESFYYLELKGPLFGRPYRFLSCDSAWMELMVETGYGGLVIIGAILLIPLLRAWKNVKGSPDRIQLYLANAMFAYYFMMLSAAMYGWGQTGYILWMLIAVSAASLRMQRARVPVAQEIPPMMAVRVPAVPSVALNHWAWALRPVGGPGDAAEPPNSTAPRSHVDRALPSKSLL